MASDTAASGAEDARQPCHVGRFVRHPELPGWQEPCPNVGIHDVVLVIQGEVLHLCDDHIIDFGREMELTEVKTQ